MRNNLKNLINIIMIIAFGVAAYLYAMFQGGFVSWFVFSSYLPLAIYSSCIFIYSLKNWYIERNFNHHEFFNGDKISISITLTRKIPFPLHYVIIEEVLPPSIEEQMMTKKIFFPWFKRKLKFEYEINSLPRGELFFKEVRVKVGDILGFIHKEHIYQCVDTILVYPTYKQVNYRHTENAIGGSASSKSLDMMSETKLVAGIREYQPGDKLTLVDWKATARKQEIMTKEFETEQSRKTILLMDCSKTQDKEGFELVISTTAAIADVILRKGIKCDFVTFSSSREIMPIMRGRTSIYDVLYKLAKIKRNPDLTLSQVIHLEKESSIKEGYMIVTSNVDHELMNSILSFGKIIKLIIASKHLEESSLSYVEKIKKRGIDVIINSE